MKSRTPKLTDNSAINTLHNHFDHLCSAGEESFQLLPWTDCVTRFANIKTRNFIANTTSIDFKSKAMNKAVAN